MIIDTAVLVARACDRYAESIMAGFRAGCLEKIVRGSATTKARLLHYYPIEVKDEHIPGQGRDGDGDKRILGRGRDGNAGPQPITIDDENDDHDDNWCAAHVDHGCLTGLTSAMYVDETNLLSQSPASSSHALPELSPAQLSSSCSRSGLYIRSRTGHTVKVSIPRDYLAFQTGEALEIITKGKFKAVPHFVNGPSRDGMSKVARNTLAVFTRGSLLY